MTRSDNKRKKDGKRDEDSDTEMVDETIDVTFEFCDLNPNDYHALKHLISQLFCINSSTSSEVEQTTPILPSKAQVKPVPKDIDIGELTDILLGDQKEWVGGTVKCDDESSDPYSFASVLDLRAHQSKPSISTLTSYLMSSIASNKSCAVSQDLFETMKKDLKPEGKGIGLLLSERLINMPVQVMPQLLSQIGNEIKHAQSQNAPGFNYSQLLIPSRVFFPPEESQDVEQANPTFERVETSDSKKNKPKKTRMDKILDENENERCLYHPEDQIISQFATHTVHFTLPTDECKTRGISSDAPEFGVKQEGRLMLIDLSKWDQMVLNLMTYIGVQA
ncbi:p21-C-terminal region-binding protein-domain-containing protein [Melampsora americana]|nr:p21-C-terminal region-binding protein-domain-containing protein [Melampsora americana]